MRARGKSTALPGKAGPTPKETEPFLHTLPQPVPYLTGLLGTSKTGVSG